MRGFVWAWRALPLLGIVLVLVLDLAFSRRIAARYHCMLWMVVAIGMTCPFSIGGIVTDDERLSLRFRLTLSHIGEVQTAQLPFPTPSASTVQVPSATSISATANIKLAPEESLLMVTPMSFTDESSQLGSTAMFYLITPKWHRGE